MMTSEDRTLLDRLMRDKALDVLEIVSRHMDRHASGQRREPHRTAWFRAAKQVYTAWSDLSVLPAYSVDVERRIRGSGTRNPAKWNARRSAATIGSSSHLHRGRNGSSISYLVRPG